MFRNYLKASFRNLLRHKTYTLINIAGLAIGVASALLILLYVEEEISYDKFNVNADHIYRVYINGNVGGDEIYAALSCAPIGAQMVNDYPEVTHSARMFTFAGDPLIKYEDKSFVLDKFFYADSSFFDIFSIKFLRGDPTTALNRSNTLVLTEEMAEKFFGDEDALGQSLKIGDEERSFEITAVVEEMPNNSHFHFNFLASYVSVPQLANSTIWVGNNNYTYILLQDEFPAKELEDKLPEMVEKYAGPQLEMFSQASYEDFKKAGNKYGYQLQSIKDIHLNSDLQYEIEPGGSKSSVYIFSAVAFFLILIASINFMNLATAKSAGRAREVGIKKVVGSFRFQLVKQFLFESLLLSFIALILALVVMELVLPSFNNFTGKKLDLLIAGHWSFLPYIIGLAILVGLLAGTYPAFYLSSFRPVNVLKGTRMTGMKGSRLRSILVVFQFIVAIFLIISTITIFKQINFIANKDLGFTKENLLVINRAYALGDKRNVFKEEISKNPAIEMISQTNNLPSYLHGDYPYRTANSGPEDIRAIYNYQTDEKLQETMEMKLLEGRWFSSEKASDSTAVVLNEAAVKAFGLENPVGKDMLKIAANADTTDRLMRIIGVVKDFHYQSLHQKVQPLIIEYNRNRFATYFALRIHPDNYQEALAFIKEKWNEIVPEQTLEYEFLEDVLITNYSDEKRSGTLFAIFAILAIFVSSLGLYGLASFSAEQRKKEIGVRKVMGATVMLIMKLLSREVILMVVFSSVISWPIAYFFTKHWLQNFAFQIKPGILTFALASIFSFLIAILTVSYQGYRAATTNPANSLRHE